jgi:4-carboxymuconolactone decarboxylase
MLEGRWPPVTSDRYRLAAIVVTKHWDAHYAWHVHAQRGIEAGLDAAAVAAIRDRQRPDFVRADEKAAFAVVSELIETRALSAGTYEDAAAALGEDALVALVGAAGFFTMAGMTLAAFDVPAPDGERPLSWLGSGPIKGIERSR